MKRLLFLLLPLDGCDSGEKSKPAPKEAPRPAPAFTGVPVQPPDGPGREQSRAAAEALERYYRLIGEGRLREAWAMRAQEPGRPALSFEAFAENYRRFAEHRATVGTPSPPAEAEGKLFVEVQVQLYGRMTSGEPFAYVGSVTMRRALSGSAGEREWKVAG